MINYLNPDFSDLPCHRPKLASYKRDMSIGDHIDVSIVTPYYNTGTLFIETFISVQAQSLQNWEWIIVDDGSTDQESVKRLAELAAKDSRIQIVRQINSGTATARNTGFRHSKGRYICLLDHDDMLEPTYLEKCVWFLDSNHEFSFCNSYSVVFGEQEFLWTKGFERNKDFLQANSGPPISVVRREAYIEVGGFDETIRVLYEDWDFWLAMAKVGHWGYTIPEFLQWYRKLGSGRYEQILQSGYENEEFAKVMQQKYAGLEENFPEITRRHSKTFEDIENNSLVCNPLAKNISGRRIMFIIPWMVTGGADRVNLDLIEGLTAQGHEVTICATLRAEHRWEYQFSQFTPDIFILPNIIHIADYPRFLSYLIQSRQIDTVVITGSTIGYHLLPYLRATSPNVAFIDMCHVEEPHWLNGGHPRFGVGYQTLLDLNIVTTQHLAKWMQKQGADSNRIRVMYTGVRTSLDKDQIETREAIRTELQIPQDIPVIIFAGRLCEQKRPTVLADILKALHDNKLNFHALIIGDGEKKLQLNNLLEQYKLTHHVQLLGSVEHQRWLELLTASDIFLMPSQYEGISIALLESIATGVIPIVAKVGGQEEIISSNDAGILIAHGTNEIQDYVDAISSLLNDNEKRQSMSAQCKAIATSKLAWNNMINHFIACINEAHQLRVEQPRHPISLSFGKELASLALEYNRLNEAVDWLWKKAHQPSLSTIQSNNPQQTTPSALPETSEQEIAIARFAILLSRTWFGRATFNNKLLKLICRKLFDTITGKNS